MFGLQELKSKINITIDSVECPVKGCQTIVARQRKIFKTEQKFQCKTHQIFIGPSTFEYPAENQNLLWKDTEDLDLLSRIKTVKRESRITRDNSEDAVTWNCYRFLEKNGLAKSLLRKSPEQTRTTQNLYGGPTHKQQKTAGVNLTNPGLSSVKAREGAQSQIS